MNKLKRLVLVCFLILSAFSLFKGSVLADRIEELQSQIDQYQKELVRLGSQSNTLKNQIAQFDAQIRLTELKISQTEEKIGLLGGRIDSLEVSLQSLTKAFSERVVETYKMTRLGDAAVYIVSAPDLSKALLRYNYLQRIQNADRDLLIRLQKAQDTYKEQKSSLEDLQENLEKQRSNLAGQKAAKSSLLTVTKNDERRYQQLLSQAKSELAAFSRFAASQGGATILTNQTKCDGWGCYYNQRDSLWGNIGLGGSPYSVAEYGCLVSSVSMLANHYGRDIKPGDIAVVSSAFVPGTGYLYHSFSVKGVGVTISAVSKSQLDSELAAGRPVIAGLYSGPDHFIVILRKEGNNYIMHDPFLENGASRPLSDKYSINDISTLRLVQFN
ncbi:hypothetical protein A2125_01090 [Candidatus Woesebacteria bacterium GWB1_43_5]|uniref:Peptidase C39 domain-containing protein n=1 Tax=Candidatus Woesebacteria bacterium GWB1_43_5 TaxID=1802474 RepID=A0A1F7WUM2_9BACT|nr:MAG: hypothetical protein A2125_01090 [Candidatus Woesebacteria bacterium GWB1_43_5]